MNEISTGYDILTFANSMNFKTIIVIKVITVKSLYSRLRVLTLASHPVTMLS
jgi:hypothetical protein